MGKNGSRLNISKLFNKTFYFWIYKSFSFDANSTCQQIRAKETESVWESESDRARAKRKPYTHLSLGYESRKWIICSNETLKMMSTKQFYEKWIFFMFWKCLDFQLIWASYVEKFKHLMDQNGDDGDDDDNATTIFANLHLFSIH